MRDYPTGPTARSTRTRCCTTILGVLCLVAISLSRLELSADTAGEWPQWRGPDGTGVAPHSNPPVEWSEKENIRWKVAIPGKGHASPIVWGDRIFLLTTIETDVIGETQPTEEVGEAPTVEKPAAPEPTEK